MKITLTNIKPAFTALGFDKPQATYRTPRKAPVVSGVYEIAHKRIDLSGYAINPIFRAFGYPVNVKRG